MPHPADKPLEMKPPVTVTIKADLLPFGVWRREGVLQVGCPTLDRPAAEPVVVEPSTSVNRIITSTPARLLRA